jgi:hypothetical protein
MATRNVTIRGAVRRVEAGRLPISGATVEIYDYNIDDWLSDSTTTDNEGSYSLSVDLEVDEDQVKFYVQASQSGCASTGRRRTSTQSSVTVNLDTTCS